MAVQNHIHLDTSLGGAPENAPSATYKVVEWTPFPTLELAVARGLTGKLFFDTITSGGNPVWFDNQDLQLQVSLAEFKAIRALIGRQVYYVENDHANDGADHTSDVRTMRLAAVKYLRRVDPMLITNLIAISLIDDDTV